MNCITPIYASSQVQMNNFNGIRPACLFRADLFLDNRVCCRLWRCRRRSAVQRSLVGDRHIVEPGRAGALQQQHDGDMAGAGGGRHFLLEAGPTGRILGVADLGEGDRHPGRIDRLGGEVDHGGTVRLDPAGDSEGCAGRGIDKLRGLPFRRPAVGGKLQGGCPAMVLRRIAGNDQLAAAGPGQRPGIRG